MRWGGEVCEETQVVMESPPPTPRDAGSVCLDIPLSSGLLALRFWGVDTRVWVCVCPSLSAAPPPEPLAAPRQSACCSWCLLSRACHSSLALCAGLPPRLTDWFFFFSFFFTNFVYLLTAPGLCCCVWPSSSCRALGCSLVAEHRLSS